MCYKKFQSARKKLKFMEIAMNELQGFLEQEKALGKTKTKLPIWLKSKLKQSFKNGIEVGRKQKIRKRGK